MASPLPVEFPNASGQKLIGMLHRPAQDRYPSRALVLLSPGIKGRIAPHRLYVKLARWLCDAGLTVFRFDSYGLGDAEGELDEKLVADVYAAVSVGRYVGDTIASLDWLEREVGKRRFIVGGLCGGAITGLLAACRDERIGCVIGFGIPVIRYGSDTSHYQHLSGGEMQHFRRGYVKRLTDWRSWARLLTLQSDFSVMLKVFLGPIQRRLGSKPSDKADSGSATGGSVANMNPLFAPAVLKALKSGTQMLLVFGERDRLYWEFDEKFFQPFRDQLAPLRDLLTLRVIKDARHVYEERSQQDELLSVISSWLTAIASTGTETSALARTRRLVTGPEFGDHASQPRPGSIRQRGIDRSVLSNGVVDKR